MKRIFLLILTCAIAFTVNAQNESDEVFTDYEINPEFPGGNDALVSFLKNNLKYPTECVRDSIEGRVLVNFVVGKDSIIRDVKVIRSVNPLLDAEACRVIRLMPKWIPGKQRGIPVRTQFNLPIKFKLSVK